MAKKKVVVGKTYLASPPHSTEQSATVKIIDTTEQTVLLDRKTKKFVQFANDNTVEVKGVLVEVLASSWPLYEMGTKAIMRTRFIKDEVAFTMPVVPASV